MQEKKRYMTDSPSWMLPMVLLAGLFCAVLVFYMALMRMGTMYAIIIALFPAALFIVTAIVTQPRWGLWAVFAVNYFIMGITRYFPSIPGGIVMDSLIGLTFLGIIIQSCYTKVEWSRVRNGFTLVTGIWLGYCVLELLNFHPDSTPQAWATGIRSIAIYIFLLAILTPLLFNRFKDLKAFLAVWSVFTLLAFAKAWWQKTHGFDSAEMTWLFVTGGARTHLIYSGIRYFSFFTDAANFGATMGMSMVVFSIYSFYVKNRYYRYYLWAVSLAAGYAMLLSGTRGSIAVPFAGYGIFLLCSRNWKTILIFGLGLVAAFVFLNYTNYGQGNSYIRRMRSAFNPDDPSFQVRLQNQDRLREIMRDLPFGAGIGMGGGKAKAFARDAALSQIPTDSWFVMIWVETGIVGLCIYLGILFYIIFRGIWIIAFRIRDPELKGVLGALIAGVFGIMVTSYGNEIMGQFPNGFIVFMSMAFIFMGLSLDKDIEDTEKKRLADEAARRPWRIIG